jgi:hypothetical protein
VGYHSVTLRIGNLGTSEPTFSVPKVGKVDKFPVYIFRRTPKLQSIYAWHVCLEFSPIGGLISALGKL